MAKKLFSALGLVAIAIALVAFTAIACGVWFVADECQRRSDRLLNEADHALDRAQPVVKTVREALDTAEKEVKAAQPPAPKDDAPVRVKMLERRVLKETPDRVSTASRAVAVLHDLLIVAQVGLDVTQDHRGELPEPKHDMSGLRKNLNESAAALQNVESILGSSRASQAIAAEDAHKIEQALAEASVVVQQVDSKLITARSQVSLLREQITTRLRYGTWAIFALSVMGALGQIALLRWMRQIITSRE